MTMLSSKPRKNIAVLFGGRSAEHEISVISALEMISAMDTLRFHPIPVYIDARGKWFTGAALLERAFYRGLPDALSKLQEVTLLPHPGGKGLTLIKNGVPSSEVLSVDVFFPVFHGQFGEDGCIQGLFELADVAYTGSPVMASAIAMNKYICKVVLQAHGIPALPACIMNKWEVVKDLPRARAQILSTPGLGQYPLFIKPCNLGSSIGIGSANNDEELSACLARVFKFDSEAIIEPCVKDMFEINVSVMEGDEPRASVVEVPASSSGALTFEDKYLRGGGKKTGRAQSQGMASLVRAIDPPTLDQHYKDAVRAHAVKAFKVLECAGLVRFDFMVDKSNGNLYFNELNPLPGSLAHYLWAKSTPRSLYTETIAFLIERAELSHSRKASLQRDVGFRALFR